MGNKQNTMLPILCWWIGGISLFLAYIIHSVAQVYNETFGIPFASLLYTISGATDGADVEFIWDLAKGHIPLVLVVIVGIFLLGYFSLQNKVQIEYRINCRRIKHTFSHRILSGWFVLCIGLISIFLSLRFLDKTMGYTEYVQSRKNLTTVYETYYVDPFDIAIAAPQQKKNLIFIYLESMETQYASVEAGGAQQKNYISGLTTLAKDNLSFSNIEKLGGFISLPGSTWTMGALYTTQTGTPFYFPVSGNSMGTVNNPFAPNVVGLGDILEEHGYAQEFLCGSDGAFAGRDKFFREHGNFEIYDYYAAVEDEAIPEDYHVWWGYDDRYLYEIAKTRILQLAERDQPFNMTMLTVDTHHVSGYVCPLCEDTYEMQLANVITCADRQLTEFVDWLEQQEFYDDTVVVIIGDHPRMDSDLVGNISYYERTLYNCFLNVEEYGYIETQNRDFAAMDIFPTVLEALDFRIEGGRLGLGTSLLSSEETLLEKESIDFWVAELSKHSIYYEEHFW